MLRCCPSGREEIIVRRYCEPGNCTGGITAVGNLDLRNAVSASENGVRACSKMYASILSPKLGLLVVAVIPLTNSTAFSYEVKGKLIPGNIEYLVNVRRGDE